MGDSFSSDLIDPQIIEKEWNIVSKFFGSPLVWLKRSACQMLTYIYFFLNPTQEYKR